MHNKQKMDAARITGTASGKAWDNSGSMLVILVKLSLIAFHMFPHHFEMKGNGCC